VFVQPFLFPVHLVTNIANVPMAGMMVVGVLQQAAAVHVDLSANGTRIGGLRMDPSMTPHVGEQNKRFLAKCALVLRLRHGHVFVDMPPDGAQISELFDAVETFEQFFGVLFHVGFEIGR
jgi:hypothetical protein